jgi:hypothetical protein
MRTGAPTQRLHTPLEPISLIMFRAQILAFFVVLFPTHHLIAQYEDNNLPDNSKVDFKEGFYFSIDMVLKNNPIQPSWIESENETYNKAFYTDQLRDDKMVYHDYQGVSQTAETEDIWGFSTGSILYAKIGRHFHEIRFIGCISYFFASETVHNHPWKSFKNDPILTKNKAYLIDFIANNVSEFDINELERILVNDPILWTEFDGLSKRERKQLKYIYLTRYNERNPCN